MHAALFGDGGRTGKRHRRPIGGATHSGVIVVNPGLGFAVHAEDRLEPQIGHMAQPANRMAHLTPGIAARLGRVGPGRGWRAVKVIGGLHHRLARHQIIKRRSHLAHGMTHCANAACADPLCSSGGVAGIIQPGWHHDLPPCRHPGRRNRTAIRAGRRHRLFHQHMRSGSERCNRRAGMGHMRGRDDHPIQTFPLHHLGDVLVSRRNAEFLSNLGQPRVIQIAYRHQIDIR